MAERLDNVNANVNLHGFCAQTYQPHVAKLEGVPGREHRLAALRARLAARGTIPQALHRVAEHWDVLQMESEKLPDDKTYFK